MRMHAVSATTELLTLTENVVCLSKVWAHAVYVPFADCLSTSLLWSCWCLVSSVSKDCMNSVWTHTVIGHHPVKDNQHNTTYHVRECTWFISDLDVYILRTLLVLHSAVSPGISSLIRFGLMLASYLKRTFNTCLCEDVKHENYLNDSLCLLGHFFSKRLNLYATLSLVLIWICMYMFGVDVCWWRCMGSSSYGCQCLW